jgi:hypothetical protein
MTFFKMFWTYFMGFILIGFLPCYILFYTIGFAIRGFFYGFKIWGWNMKNRGPLSSNWEIVIPKEKEIVSNENQERDFI